MKKEQLKYILEVYGNITVSEAVSIHNLLKAYQ
jgi:hypothetical protein